MPPEATQEQGATTERLMGILGWSDAESTEAETTEKKEAVDTKAAPKAKPAETTEEVTQESEATAENETEEKSEAETTEETKDAEQTDDAQEEVTLPATLSELAEALGVDSEKLFEIKVKTKVDGAEGEATLAQILKSYQLESHLTRKSMELSEQRKTIEQAAQQAQTEVAQRIEYLDGVLAVAGQILNDRYKDVKWDELKANNPTEFNTKYIEYQQHQQQLSNIYQALQTERQKGQLQNQQQFAKYVEEENKALLNAVPEWADAKVAKKEQAEIREYLKGLGYSSDEVNTIYDHRLVLVVRDALKARQLQAAKPQVLKKVVQAPKLVKPGTKSTKGEGLRERLRNLRTAHKTGNKQAGVNYLIESGLAD